MYLNTYELDGIFPGSDYYPIIFSTQLQICKAKAFPFLFQNFWTKYQNVDAIVSANWQHYHRVTNMFQFMLKLRSIKHDLKELSKRYVRNFNDKVMKNVGKIEYMEEKLIVNSTGYRFNS